MISIPTWVATALLVFLLGQFGGAVLWGISADRRQAITELQQTQMLAALAEIRADLKSSNISLLSARVTRLEDESAEHKAAHARNRDRIEDALRMISAVHPPQREHSA